MKLDINKAPGKNLEAMAVGLCQVLDGLTLLLSLGFVRPRVFFWFVKGSTPFVTSRRRLRK